MRDYGGGFYGACHTEVFGTEDCTGDPMEVGFGEDYGGCRTVTGGQALSMRVGCRAERLKG